MPSWQEVTGSKEYQSLPLHQQQIKKVQFFNDVILKSPKYAQLKVEQQNKVFRDLFPNNEYSKIAIREGLSGLWKEWKKLPPIKYGDIAVEETAKFIEPEVPAGRTTLGLMTKDLPRQIGAEFIRAYKPSTLLPFLAGAKAIKPVVSPVGKLIWKKTPEGVKKVLLKELTIGKGQPIAYQEMAKEAQLGRLVGMREAEKVAKILTTKPTGKILTGEEQRYIGRIFRKEVIESPALKVHPRYQELKTISDEGRAIMDKWSETLVKSGIPKEQAKQVIEENVGQYMARMYTTKLKPQTGMFGAIKNLRLRLSGLKHRKDLSTEVRNLMGEIKEPALPTAIRVKEISTSIANNKLFNRVAQNPEWVSNTGIKGWVKMPDTPSVGALKGKWVIPEIAEDINAITKVGEQAQGLYLKALSAWKYMKVPLNPATQVRNLISNTILLDLSGTNHLKQLQLFPRAFRELLSKGKFYQQALDDGALGGEFVGTETMQKLRDFYLKVPGNNLQRWMNIAKMPFRKAGELYQGMERLSKMVKYIDVLEKGGTRQFAAQEAQKWLFDYREVPKFVDFARKSPFGAPFITFTYKAIPRIAETLVNRPMALYKYYALFNGVNETSRKYLGMSGEEYARQKKLLPPYLLKDIGGIPTNLLLPFRDKYGRTQWLNLEYILPLGQAPEILERGLKGWVSNPLYNIVADLSKNSDFRGKPIIPIGATSQEATQAVISHIYRQLVPNLAPSIPTITKGGYSFEKIMDSVLKRPDFADRTKDLTPVLLDTLVGIKINYLDVTEAEQFKMWDKKKRIDELKKQVIKLNHPAISEQEREKQAEILFKKMQKIIEEE